jgi:hypothetical protein
MAERNTTTHALIESRIPTSDAISRCRRFEHPNRPLYLPHPQTTCVHVGPKCAWVRVEVYATKRLPPPACPRIGCVLEVLYVPEIGDDSRHVVPIGIWGLDRGKGLKKVKAISTRSKMTRLPIGET